MADHTRSQDLKRLDETIKKLSDATTDSIRLLTETNEKHAATMNRLTESNNKTTEAMEGIKELVTMLSLKYTQISEKVLVHPQNPPLLSNPHVQNQFPHQTQGLFRPFQPKLEFPRFSGNEPEAWLYKCEKFFDFNAIDETQKIRLASLHLDDKAIHWFRWFEKSHTLQTWREFSKALSLRFGENVYDDAVGQLTKLKQWGSVKLYQEKFEELANKTSGLSEEFFISCFVSGLKEEIRGGVQMFRPKSISEAMGLARLQEDTFEALNKKNRVSTKPYIPPLTPSPRLPETGPKLTETGTSIRKMTQRDFDDRRAKGLCFGCDEKYFRGHVCKKKQIFMLEAEEEEEIFEDTQQELLQGDTQEEFQISLHALSGIQSYRTMRIIGQIKKKMLHILIDSGSTHNFLDPKIAKTTGVESQPTNPLTVVVADGTKIFSKAIVKDCTWTVQGVEFTADMRLLPLGGCDMVLGVQWLSTLGPVLWDFKNLKMEFTVLGTKHTLKGGEVPAVQLVDAKAMEQLLRRNPQGIMAQMCSIQVESSEQIQVNPEISILLQNYEDVFSEPKSLPPVRAHDHQIPLFPGTQPPSIRPYRYPYIQKNEIEKIVREMMATGVIRHSFSPYSSPVLLVKKKR